MVEIIGVRGREGDGLCSNYRLLYFPVALFRGKIEEGEREGYSDASSLAKQEERRNGGKGREDKGRGGRRGEEGRSYSDGRRVRESEEGMEEKVNMKREISREEKGKIEGKGEV